MEKKCNFNTENIDFSAAEPSYLCSPGPKSSLRGSCEGLPVFCCGEGCCSGIGVLLWVIAWAWHPPLLNSPARGLPEMPFM